jgi:hypothetical protein
MQPRVKGGLLLNIPNRALHSRWESETVSDLNSDGTNNDGEDVGQFAAPLEAVITTLNTLQRRLAIGGLASMTDVISTLGDAGNMISEMLDNARDELSPSGRGAGAPTTLLSGSGKPIVSFEG